MLISFLITTVVCNEQFLPLNLESQFTIQSLKYSAHPINGFKFCSILENSYFGKRSVVNHLNTNDNYLSYLSNILMNKSISFKLVHRIETIALKIHHNLRSKKAAFPLFNDRGNWESYPIDKMQNIRLACFLAAFGNNPWYTEAVESLQQVDLNIPLKFNNIPNTKLNQSRNKGSKINTDATKFSEPANIASVSINMDSTKIDSEYNDKNLEPVNSNLLHTEKDSIPANKDSLHSIEDLQLIFVEGLEYFPKLNYPKLKDIISGKARNDIIERDSKLKKFSHAIAFMCYKDIELTKRSLSRFHNDNLTITLIHIDKKSSDDYVNSLHEFVKSQNYKNVHFSKRFSVHWGHHSIVETEQYMFGQLLEMGYWSHVFLVGGDCYPLLNAYNMAKKLNETGDLMFIGKNHKNHLWDEWQWKTKPWVLTTNNTAGTILSSYKLTTLFEDYKVIGGLQWLTFSRKFLNSFFTSPQSSMLQSRMEWIFAAEEDLYHTWATRFIPDYISQDLKIFFDWPIYSPSSPIILKETEYSAVKEAKLNGKLYMRKVSLKNPLVMYSVDVDQFPDQVIKSEELKFGSLRTVEEIKTYNRLRKRDHTCLNAVLGSFMMIGFLLF